MGFIETVHVEAVIERIGVFVEEDEDVCRRGEVGGFEELSVIRVKAIGEDAGVSYERVEGDAADARACEGAGAIRGAMEDLDAAVEEGAEEGGIEVDAVGILLAVAPVLDIVGPVFTTFAGFIDAVVIDEAVEVVVGIEHPGERELFDVTETSDPLGFAFGFGECGEEEAGQDGDDGDDDEEFDEGECRMRGYLGGWGCGVGGGLGRAEMVGAGCLHWWAIVCVGAIDVNGWGGGGRFVVRFLVEWGKWSEDSRT